MQTTQINRLRKDQIWKITYNQDRQIIKNIRKGENARQRFIEINSLEASYNLLKAPNRHKVETVKNRRCKSRRCLLQIVGVTNECEDGLPQGKTSSTYHWWGSLTGDCRTWEIRLYVVGGKFIPTGLKSHTQKDINYTTNTRKGEEIIGIISLKK